MCVCSVAKLCLILFPWIVARQAPPLFIRFPRQEYLSGLLFPSPEDCPDPGTEPVSHALAATKGALNCLFSSLQLLSRIRLLATPRIAARQASLSITNSQSSLKFMSIESVMPSSHLILSCPLLLPPIPPSMRVISNESTLRMRWPKYWSFSLSISPSNEHPGPISFRMDWLDLLAVQGTLDRLLTAQKHQFFGAQLSSQSNSHIHT